MFWKRKPRPETASGPHSPARNPLEAIPLIPDYVEAKEDSDSLLQVKRDLPLPQGISGFLVTKLKLKNASRLKLDQYGSYFWKLIDGQRNLEEISRLMSEKFQVDEKESRKSAILFIQQLMVRGFIALKIEKAE